MGSESDDLDAGWDEVPASAAAPSAPVPRAAAPVSGAPAASGASVTPVESFEALPPVSRRPGAYVSSESLSPAEVTTPPPSVEQSPVSRFGPIAAVVALAAASIVWFGRAPNPAPPPAVAAAQPPREPVPRAPADAPAAPASEPAVVAAPEPTPAPERLELEPLVLEAPKKSDVIVRSVPDGASFFEAGKRLGAGTVHVNVAHDGNASLTALLNGYRPLNFKIDGSRDTVTVLLTPAGERRPATERPAVPAPARAP